MASHTEVEPIAPPDHACAEVSVAIATFQADLSDLEDIGPDAAEISVRTGNLIARKCGELCADGCIIRREIGARLKGEPTTVHTQVDRDLVATVILVFSLTAGPLDIDDL